MQSIGRKDTISVPGLCNPTTATIRPSVAAMLYAGAVEETAITTLESSPSAPARRPLSWVCADAAGAEITGGAVVSALTRVAMGCVPPSARAGCRGYGSTISQYHIAVQVFSTKFFDLPQTVPCRLAPLLPWP